MIVSRERCILNLENRNVKGGKFMNIGFGMCIVLVPGFALVGLLFGIFKERSARFVLGILFFKDVHFDTYKAFEKYLLK